MWRAAFPLRGLVQLILLAVLGGLSACTGCDRPGTGGGPGAAPAPTPSVSASAPVLAMRSSPAPVRLVAIGDLHGDLAATRKVLVLAGAIDASDAWVGGKLVVVQTGDAIDRGDDDRAVLDLLERLKGEAAKAGGELVAMSGNHEIMNASFDFRYVTPPSFRTFADVKPMNPGAVAALEHVDAPARGRAAAFAPGGTYATMISKRPVMYRAGDTVFVHGGILPKHIAYGIDRINDETRAWLLGEKSDPPRILLQEDGPIWSRMYSASPGREECAILKETLDKLGAKRMVMGHTPQRSGISAACEGRGWRIDVGLSKFYGGPMQALAIEGDTVTVLKE